MPGMNNGLDVAIDAPVTGPGTPWARVPEITQVELVIGGMTCAACAARVQARLNKVTGVTASVNLSTERAYISAPATVSAPDLIGVVEAAGYTAELTRPAEAEPGETADQAAVRRLRRRLTLVPDNASAIVADADAVNPRFTAGWLDYAQARGFVTDAARVRSPKDKPKGGAGRAVRARELLRRGAVRRADRGAGPGRGLVPGRRRDADPRHHRRPAGGGVRRV
ncbi:MAG TPA: cation transporter [Streptosporangiaceae bacterium]|nr:cation transporter [Streptosporangiaceae bacterium]